MVRFSAAWLLIALCLVIWGCSNDEPVAPDPDGQPEYADLSQPDHVLFNMERSINQREIGEYARLVDDGFVFYFSPADIDEDRVRVPEWDVEDELVAMKHMFDLYYPYPKPRPTASATPPQPWSWGRMRDHYWELSRGRGHPASHIAFTIVSSSEWTTIDPYEAESFPNEQHMESVIEYNFTLAAGDFTFTSVNPKKAIVHIRRADVGGQSLWRLLAWHDDVAAIPQRFRSMRSKDHALIDLELAYDRRDYYEYARLLHKDFIFIFSKSEGSLPWTAQPELNATTNLFFVRGKTANETERTTVTWGALKKLYDDAPTAVDPVVSVELDLVYPPGAGTWIDVGTPGDPAFMKIIEYKLTVKGEARTYETYARKASILVATSEVGGKTIWQIRTFADDLNL